jgi:hypothetical protein
MKTRKAVLWLVLAFLIIPTLAFAAPQYMQSPPLADVIRTPVGEVKPGNEVLLPIITWGGDIATIFANGNSLDTTKESILGKKNLKFKLVRQDDFKKQVEMYLKGETPYLRGTMGMINMAMEAISKDPRTKPVVIYQMTNSSGGDCAVVKAGIETVKDFKGKTIVLQPYGPHVDYLTTLLRDAGLSIRDVKIRWVKDLTGTENSPLEAFYDKSVDVAFMISPDANKLTSGGKVGTGSEGSVKGARILMSTKTADQIIYDVYVVRSDYFARHKKEVQAFVHGLLLGEQQLSELFKNKEGRMAEYKTMITAAAQILLDSPQATADAEGMYADCTFVGFRGNVKFFTDLNWPRNFTKVTSETQIAFMSLGLLSRQIPLESAKWNFDELRTGLTGIGDVEVPRFKPEEVARVVEQKRAMGTLKEGELFSFEIFFKPNQNDFPTDMYADDFKRVNEFASTYGGAVITIEGHSDPLGYLQKKKDGIPEMVLRQIKQAAKNLSISRAVKARDSLMEFAKGSGISLDQSQFTVVGHGITQPKSGMCGDDPCAPKTKEAWLSNMRVVFRVIQVEAESSVFKPLD